MRHVIAGLLALSLIAAGAACGDDDGDTGSTPAPTTTRPTTTTTEPELSDEEEITQLVEDWFGAAQRLSGVGGDLAELDDYLTGDYLAAFRSEAEARVADGLSVEPDPDGGTSMNIEQIAVDGDTAEVTECIVDADLLVNAESGAVIDDSVIARRYVTEAIRTPDGWRLSQRASSQSWEGVTSCDE